MSGEEGPEYLELLSETCASHGCPNKSVITKATKNVYKILVKKCISQAQLNN